MGGNYTSSTHGNSTSGVNRSSIDSKYSTYAIGNCAHCHEAHASMDGVEPFPSAGIDAGPDKVLLFSEEEGVCEACHYTIVPRNVKDQSGKTYRHPMHDYSGRHTLREYGQSGAPFRDANRHAECADCHEPHFIGYPGTTYHTYNAGTPADNNLVSNAIKGVWGVEPDSSPLWTATKTFTEQKTVAVGSTKEYQICYKCHSYYAFQDSDGVTAIVGPSGDYITDQAMEFSPGNASAHPVQVTLNNLTGSSSPKALDSVQISSPWTNVGNQTMWCCDCHGNDAASPVGPHGSNAKFMLKGTGKYWPTKSDGTTLWKLNTTDAQNSDLFCKNCHPIYSSGWMNNVHSHNKHSGSECVECHVAVPHGSAHSRLIAYSTDPAPYDYNNSYAKITSYTKRSRTSYSKNDCTATCAQQH